MRRLAAFGFVALALLGACGSSGDDTSADAGGDTAGALSKLAAGSAAADVCGGREAVNIGAAFSAALSKANEVDYTDVAAALRKAADAAPAEIKDDFRVIADAEGPFLNFMALAQNSEYQAAIAKLGEADFQAASRNVNDWFASHCS